MASARIVSVTLVIMLSVASCINWPVAERRSPSSTVLEPPSAEGSVAGRARDGATPSASLREPRADRGEAAPRFQDPPGAGEDLDTWAHVRHLMTVVPVRGAPITKMGCLTGSSRVAGSKAR